MKVKFENYFLGEFISILNLINLFDNNINDIISEYYNKGDQEIKILSCYEESKKENKYLIGIKMKKKLEKIVYYYLMKIKLIFLLNIILKIKEIIQSKL